MTLPNAASIWVMFPWWAAYDGSSDGYRAVYALSEAIGSWGSWKQTLRKNGLVLSRPPASQRTASSATSGPAYPVSLPTARPLRTKLTGSRWFGRALFWVANQWSNPWSSGCGWAGSLNFPFMCHLPTWQVAYPAFRNRAATVTSDRRTWTGDSWGIQFRTPTRVGVRPVIRAGPGRRTVPVGGVARGELEPLPGERVEVRRLQILGTVAREVAVPEVVRQYDDDVRPGRRAIGGRGRGRHARHEQNQEQGSSHERSLGRVSVGRRSLAAAGTAYCLRRFVGGQRRNARPLASERAASLCPGERPDIVLTDRTDRRNGEMPRRPTPSAIVRDFARRPATTCIRRPPVRQCS